MTQATSKGACVQIDGTSYQINDKCTSCPASWGTSGAAAAGVGVLAVGAAVVLAI